MLTWLQDNQPNLNACSSSYTDAHGRLQSDVEALDTVTVAVQGPIDPYRFNLFMSDLLAERGSDIKQMHGILSIQVSHCMRHSAGTLVIYTKIKNAMS